MSRVTLPSSRLFRSQGGTSCAPRTPTIIFWTVVGRAGSPAALWNSGRFGGVVKLQRSSLAFAACLVVALGIGLPSTAHAATITVTDADCSATTTGAPITGASGDVIRITGNFSTCTDMWVSKSLVSSSSAVVVTNSGTLVGPTSGGPSNSLWLWAVTGGGSFTDIQITLGPTPATVSNGVNVRRSAAGTTWAVTNTGGPSGGDRSSSSASSPPSVIQEFGKPAAGTCDAAEPAGLNWAGVTSGSWGESWAQWMNGGNGGAVCTRTLIYSTAQSRWIVG